MKLFQTKTISILLTFIVIILEFISLNSCTCNNTPNSTAINTYNNVTNRKGAYTARISNYTKAFNIADDVQGIIFNENEPSRETLSNNGWQIQQFSTCGEMLDTTISQMKQRQIFLYDLVAHADPLRFNSMALSIFINKIKTKCTLDTNTVLYLNGCNTGVPQYTYNNDQRSAAEIIANSIGCIVYGSKGYLKGTFAQQNEQCYKSNNEGTDAYPDSENASGKNVWKRFEPKPSHLKKRQMPNINTGFKDTYVFTTNNKTATNLDTLILKTISGKKINSKIDSIQFNMFPDVVFILNKKTYAVFNSFRYIIDQENKNVYFLESKYKSELITLLKEID